MNLIDRPSKEEFALIVANAHSVKDVVRALGYGTVNGANSTTVKKRINREQLNTSHFKIKMMKSYTDDEVFCKNTAASQSVLRRRYKANAYTSYCCSICKQPPMWQNKPLTLILDHIDGDNKNGELTNLRWVCPNCNQQLPTTGFHGVKYRDPLDTVQLPKAQPKKPKTTKPTKRPEYDELIVNVFKHSFTYLGKLYGVSPNAVQRWLKFYNVPHTKKAFISWYYINILQEEPPIKKQHDGQKSKPKAVLQYTKSGELIGKYISITAASKNIFGDALHAVHISDNCLNKRKSAYGYVWKFEE